MGVRVIEYHYVVKWSAENGWERAVDMDEYLAQDQGIVFDTTQPEGEGWRLLRDDEEAADAKRGEELVSLLSKTKE